MDAQRAAILDAAHALLSEAGYASCSVAAVAARAGIGTGTVYRYFPGKAELVVELFRSVVGREVAAVRAAAATAEPSPERVVAIVQTFATRALQSPRLAYALLAEPVDAAVEAERLEFRRVFADAIATRITEAVTARTLPPQDADITAAALVGAVAEVLTGPLSGGADAGTVPALADFTLRALGHTTGGSDATHT